MVRGAARDTARCSRLPEQRWNLQGGIQQRRKLCVQKNLQKSSWGQLEILLNINYHHVILYYLTPWFTIPFPTPRLVLFASTVLPFQMHGTYNQVPVTNSETRTIAVSLSPTVVSLTNMHSTTTLRVLLGKPD